MDEKRLLKFSIIVSLVGILLLFGFSKLIIPKSIEISKIDEMYIEKMVFVEGIIKSVNINDNRTIFFLDNSTIMFLAFSKIELNKGDNVAVEGKVLEYNDYLEIIVDKIELK